MIEMAEKAGLDLYHGSGNGFDKFDFSKLKEGEGGNAFGAGAYLTDEKKVAEYYKNMLADEYHLGGNPIDSKTDEGFMLRIATDLKSKGYSKDEIKSSLMDRAITSSRNMDDIEKFNRLKAAIPKAIDNYDNLSKGYLYKVNVDIGDHNTLDWNQPYSNQSEGVKKILDEIGFGNYQDPKEILKSLGNGKVDDPSAAKKLSDYGIKAIKHDTISGAERKGGAKNYAVLDPSILKIMERNGEKIAGAAAIGGIGGGATLMATPQNSYADSLHDVVMKAKPTTKEIMDAQRKREDYLKQIEMLNRDDNAIQAPQSNAALSVASGMEKYNKERKKRLNPVIDFVLPAGELPVEYMQKIGYGDDITFKDRLNAVLGML